jgi:hypothetical protein
MKIRISGYIFTLASLRITRIADNLEILLPERGNHLRGGGILSSHKALSR